MCSYAKYKSSGGHMSYTVRSWEEENKKEKCQQWDEQNELKEAEFRIKITYCIKPSQKRSPKLFNVLL